MWLLVAAVYSPLIVNSESSIAPGEHGEAFYGLSSSLTLKFHGHHGAKASPHCIIRSVICTSKSIDKRTLMKKRPAFPDILPPGYRCHRAKDLDPAVSLK